MRDACRTLAVLGNKSLIPDIKPLLQVPDLAVQKDAADAISIFERKEQAGRLTVRARWRRSVCRRVQRIWMMWRPE